MIRRLLVMVAVIFAAPIFAQEGTPSPYSFFGIGSLSFRGTIENQAMGGLSVMGDSIHLNLQNPAGYGALRLTNFIIGSNHQRVSLESDTQSGKNTSSTIDYLALGFPLSKKMGAGFGLIPYTSVDYNIQDENENSFMQFSGRGGLNRAFVSFGYEIFSGFRLGVTGNYNFGSIRNESILDENDVAYGVREVNQSDLHGLSFNLGAQYQTKLNEKLTLHSSLNYIPEANLTVENERDLETVVYSREDDAVIGVVDTQEVPVEDRDLSLPSKLTVGLGLGEENKWFAGAEFTNLQASDFSNRTYDISGVNFVNASQFRLGGYYVPRYNSITSYWQRVTYRAGFRMEETGLRVDNEDINEFGISFGVGLPLGRGFSNANLTFEYGQRGTKDSGLVKEDIFKIGLSLSLNGKWFVPNKFN